MRTFTSFANRDPVARELVGELPTLKGNPEGYRQNMRALGEHLASGILGKLQVTDVQDICVICTVEDADFLARGLIDVLEASEFSTKVHLICLWNERVKNAGVSISPVIKSYQESFNPNKTTFIVVKSIISGACVVKTNLTRAISMAIPERIFIAAPVMLKGAESRLAREFPADVMKKFEFVHFATDTEKSEDGEDVIPGIGGSVYDLLGLGGKANKNKYMPEIVKERRRRMHPEMA